MNIDDYRAMKAQMEQEKQNQGGASDAQAEPTTVANPTSGDAEGTKVPEQAEQTPSATETNQNQEQNKVVDKLSTTPLTVEIDGKEVSLDELKNGYLRQSDYTRKTQELSRKSQQAEEAIQFINQVKQNPEIAQQLSSQFGAPILDPVQSQVSELESKYYDLLIQTDLRNLHDKYGDFNETEVLQLATSENISNLETAYQLYKVRQGGGEPKPMDIDSLKQSLRDEILQELKSQQEANVDTSTIIQTGGDMAPTNDVTPSLTLAQKKVARAMKMSEDEYLKWASKK